MTKKQKYNIILASTVSYWNDAVSVREKNSGYFAVVKHGSTIPVPSIHGQFRTIMPCYFFPWQHYSPLKADGKPTILYRGL